MSGGEAESLASGAVDPQTRRTARNAVTRAGAEIIGKGSTLAWTLVAARTLTRQEFGAFAFALSFSVLLASLPEWGFPSALLQRGSREPRQISTLHFSALVWQIGLALPVLTVGVLIAGQFRPSHEARVTLALVSAAVLLDMVSDPCRTTAAALQRQVATSTALALQRVATAVLIVAGLQAGTGIIGMGTGLLAGSALGVLTHTIALRNQNVRYAGAQLDRPGLRRFFNDTRIIGLSSLLLMALFRVDAVLISAFHNDSEVAVYAAAYRLLETVLFVTWSINSAMTPIIASASSDLDTVRRGLTAEFTAVAVIYLPFAALLLAEAEPVLLLLFGQTYEQHSAAPLRWLALSPVVYAFAFFANYALFALGKARVVLGAAAVALAVNVGLNLVLIPPFAGAGAGAATTLSYLALAVCLYLKLRPVLGGLRLARAILEPGTAALVLAVVVEALRLPLLVEAPIGATAYLMTWVGLVRWLDPDQLRVVRSVFPGGRL